MQRGDPIELNFEGLEIQKWNIPTNWARRVDQVNGVILLVIIFTPGVMVIKMSKMAYFLYFLLTTAKISHSLGKFFSCTLWALSVGIFHFHILRPSKFSSMGSPFCIMFCSVKYTFTFERWHIQAC